MTSQPFDVPAAETLVLVEQGEQRHNPSRGAFHGSSPAGRAVARWHDDVHSGAFSTCFEQPCHAVNRVDG